MRDFRAEIPVRAFLNAGIIDCAMKTGALTECVQRVLTNVGFPPNTEYQFKNPAFICSLLYCLIVVPKEIWIESKDDPIYARLDNNNLCGIFEITIKDTKWSLSAFNLIHSLRNAIAHANFIIDDTQAFTFWNQNKGGPRRWEARISNPKLMQFLSKLAHVIVFLRDDPDRHLNH